MREMRAAPVHRSVDGAQNDASRPPSIMRGMLQVLEAVVVARGVGWLDSQLTLNIKQKLSHQKRGEILSIYKTREFILYDTFVERTEPNH